MLNKTITVGLIPENAFYLTVKLPKWMILKVSLFSINSERLVYTFNILSEKLSWSKHARVLFRDIQILLLKIQILQSPFKL